MSTEIIKTISVVTTLVVTVGTLIFSMATIAARVNENAAAIAERKLSGKTVRQHGNRIVELETHVKHFQKVHDHLIDIDKTQDKTIEDVRVRVRALESGK